MPSTRSGRANFIDDDDMEEEEQPVAFSNPMGLPLKELQRLKSRFTQNGQLVPLNEEEFVQALSSNHASADPEKRDQLRAEVCTLFKKIDAFCTDRVDWEEFTNYMLLHMPGFSSGEGACELAQNAQGADGFAIGWGSGHADMINCVTVINDTSAGVRRYITAGRDGFIKVWHPNLTLHKSILVGGHQSWLAACCWMPKSRRLAVASSRFKIYFYDSSFGNQSLCHIDHKDGTPLCLDSTQSYESDGREKEILMVGDNNGCVTVYPMDDDWTDYSNDNDKLAFNKAKPIRTRYHNNDWVTKVGFVPELQAMVTCGLDGDINLCDVNLNQRKEAWKDPIRLHKKGVHSWCWCRSYKFFASGGLDRQIIVWNPYTQKAMNYLQGHNAAVIDVLCNENQHQLISLSVDKVVKVWDIRNYRCIQTFTDKTEYKPEDRLTCMAFDDEGPALIMCSNTLNVLPVSVKVETSRTHLAPIVGALFNDDFNQIVSGDNSGTICVWCVRSGKLEFEYRRAHGDHRLTCIAFDESKRRLYTGGEDGVLKLWNFSSGQQLRMYTMPNPCEITSLLWAREGPNTFVVGLSWEKIYVWPGSGRRMQTVEVQNILEDVSGQGHTDDISCIAHFSSGQLATGGDDGNIIFWKIQETSSTVAGSIRRYRLSDTTATTPGPTENDAKQSSGVGGYNDAKRSLAATSAAAPASSAAKKGTSKAVGQSAEPTGRSGGIAASKTSRTSVLGNADAPAKAVESQGASPYGERRTSAAGGDIWPEELGTWDDQSTVVAGVEKMLYLETKEVLISSHSDRIVRIWSTTKAEFCFRLQLLAPAPPPEELHEEPDDKDILDAIARGTTPTKAARSKSPAEDKVALTESTPQPSGSAPMTLPGMVPDAAASVDAADATPGLVNSQVAAITELYTDIVHNRYLFTGDAEGFVRIWDMSELKPHVASAPRYLLRLQEMQPHRQAVTHLQYFELDGQRIVMSASADCTIVMCTFDGQRIGTFGGKGPSWKLSAGLTGWSQTQETLEVLFSPHEEIGIDAHFDLGHEKSGLVHEVDDRHQAHKKGVMVGMVFVSVQGEPYTKDRLDAASVGNDPYKVIFAKAQSQRLPSNEGPRTAEEDDGYYTGSPTRGAARHPGMRATGGSGIKGGTGMGQKKEVKGKVSTRQPVKAPPSGRGIFQELNLPPKIQPDLKIYEQEKVRLSKQPVRSEPP